MKREGELKYLNLSNLVWKVDSEYLQRKLEEFQALQQRLVPTQEELKVDNEIFQIAKERFESITIPKMIELNQSINSTPDIQD